MTLELLKSNLNHMKEITREIYVFTNHLSKINDLEISNQSNIDQKEKKLLEDSITSLTNQLEILNNSIPGLINQIKFYQDLEPKKAQVKEKIQTQKKEEFVEIKYNLSKEKAFNVEEQKQKLAETRLKLLGYSIQPIVNIK